ncbi:HK97 gp10 family phage protein [Persephonella sp.]
MAGTFGFDKFHKFLDRKVKEFKEKERRFLKETAARAEKYAKEEVPVDTGHLRRSIKTEIGDDWSAVGTNVEYGPAQERGAIIRPVKAKFLAIPISKKIKKQTEKYGSPRAFIDALKKQGYSIFVEDGVIKASKKKKVISLFVLRKQTKIEGKHFLENAKIKVIQEITEIIRGL